MTPNISSVSDIASFPCEIMPILRDFNAVYMVLPHIHAFLLIYGFVCQITLFSLTLPAELAASVLFCLPSDAAPFSSDEPPHAVIASAVNAITAAKNFFIISDPFFLFNYRMKPDIFFQSTLL